MSYIARIWISKIVGTLDKELLLHLIPFTSLMGYSDEKEETEDFTHLNILFP